jgi:hypothetical protein
MCTSFYLGALKAATLMGRALGDEVKLYEELLEKGLRRMESELFEGEYFIQQVEWKNLRAKNPLKCRAWWAITRRKRANCWKMRDRNINTAAAASRMACSVRGWRWCAAWGQVVDVKKIAAHLTAVHKYNLKRDLTAHPNPQRLSYACGEEGGLLLCALLQGLSGARYDAVEKILYLQPGVKGDFRSFISTATGYGTVGVKRGKPFLEVKAGVLIAGRSSSWRRRRGDEDNH